MDCRIFAICLVLAVLVSELQAGECEDRNTKKCSRKMKKQGKQRFCRKTWAKENCKESCDLCKVELIPVPDIGCARCVLTEDGGHSCLGCPTYMLSEGCHFEDGPSDQAYPDCCPVEVCPEPVPDVCARCEISEGGGYSCVACPAYMPSEGCHFEDGPSDQAYPDCCPVEVCKPEPLPDFGCSRCEILEGGGYSCVGCPAYMPSEGCHFVDGPSDQPYPHCCPVQACALPGPMNPDE